MTSQSEALVFVAYGFSLAFFSTLAIRQVQQIYRRVKFEQQYRKHPRLVAYDKTKRCQKPHSWQDVQLVLRDLPPGKYKVCVDCGAMMGREDFMVSKEVLEAIAEAKVLTEKRLEIERQVQARIKDLTDAYVEAYVARNFASEVNDVHFAERLKKLADYTISALASASEKVTDELTGQAELEEKYKDWLKILGVGSKRGGNA